MCVSVNSCTIKHAYQVQQIMSNLNHLQTTTIPDHLRHDCTNIKVEINAKFMFGFDSYLSEDELLPVIGDLHPSERYYGKQQAEYAITEVFYQVHRIFAYLS